MTRLEFLVQRLADLNRRRPDLGPFTASALFEDTMAEIMRILESNPGRDSHPHLPL